MTKSKNKSYVLRLYVLFLFTHFSLDNKPNNIASMDAIANTLTAIATSKRVKKYDPSQQTPMKGCLSLYFQLVPTHESDIPLAIGNYAILMISNGSRASKVKRPEIYKIEGIYWAKTMFMVVGRWMPRGKDLPNDVKEEYKRVYGKEMHDREVFYSEITKKRPISELATVVKVGVGMPHDSDEERVVDYYCQKFYDSVSKKVLDKPPALSPPWSAKPFGDLQTEVDNLRKGQWKNQRKPVSEKPLAGVPLRTDEKLEEASGESIEDDADTDNDADPIPPPAKRKLEESVPKESLNEEEAIKRDFFDLMDLVGAAQDIVKKLKKRVKREWMDTAIKREINVLVNLSSWTEGGVKF